MVCGSGIQFLRTFPMARIQGVQIFQERHRVWIKLHYELWTR